MRNGKKMLAGLLTATMVVSSVMTNGMTAQAATKKAVSSVKVTNVDGKTLVMKKNKTYKLKTSVKTTGGATKAVTYSTSNKKIVTVSSKGLLKAKKNGNAKITVKSKFDKKKKAVITVKVGTPVSKITVADVEKTIAVGDTYQVDAAVSPAKATVKTVKYSTSDAEVAKVNKKGVVTALKAGTADITVTSKDGNAVKTVVKITVAEAVPIQVETLSYAGYDLKWQDEFLGDTLNRDDWNVELHDPAWVNEELQAYVDSTDNIYVKNGELVIKPIKKVGADGKATYTSGRVNTQGKHDFKYGLFEARVKVPEGKGYLPAFWMMPTDENLYGQWPRCGEIDAMEVMGQDNTTLYGTIHYGLLHRSAQGTYTLPKGNFTDNYHLFSCEWEPGKITWYVDGIKYHEADNWYSKTPGQGTVAYPAPFDQPFYMILNLAVGGSWVGNPDETTDFDKAAYTIDYVKVFQKDSYDENVKKPEKEVVLRDPDANGNYINNGDFAVAEDLTDDENWKFLTAKDGEATAKIADNTMKIDTTKEGTVDYSVQLVQANVPFEMGSTYTVSFDAKAAAARKMNCAIKAPDYDYAEYMSENVALTTEFKTYTYEFKMTEESDPNGRLEFNMGAAGSTAAIEIKNVSIKKTKPYDPTAPEEKTVLADGNYVYNGSFQEGEGRLGYWDVKKTDAATVEVTNLADGRRLHVVSNAATADAVTVSQKDMAIDGKIDYALSFWAQAAAGKTVELTYTVAGVTFTDTITDTNTKVSHVIKSADVKGKDIVFNLGNVGEIYIDNVRFEENALIKNGSFDAGLTGYEWWRDDSTDATCVVDSLTEKNAADITINKTGDQDWKIQLKQNDVELVKGQCYKLTFKAKSSVDRKIRVIMQGGEDKGWAVYSGENIVDLTKDYQTFEKCFKMTSATDPKAFLSICLGQVGDPITVQHRVCIDDISLVEIDESEMPAKPETSKDNLLSNANFSDEAGAFTSWTENIGDRATKTIKDGAITYDITDVGKDDWDVQLKQSGISLKAGNSYTVSFDVTSSEARTIKSGMMSTTYAWYGGGDFALEKDTPFTVTYKVKAAEGDDAADFFISMGQIKKDDGTLVTTPASKITISNLKLVDDSAPSNMLVNADFSDKADAFASWTENIGDRATKTIKDGVLTYDITNVGKDDWDIQLKQSGVNLVAGKTYKVTFEVTSSEARTVKSGMMSTTYAWYGGGDFALEKDTPFTVTYTVKAAEGDEAADFFISMGQIKKDDGTLVATPASKITISKLSLVEVTE